MIIRGNSLKGSYRNYILRNLKQTIDEIPLEHRQALAEDIQTKASILGCKDPEILRAAVQCLKGENNANL